MKLNRSVLTLGFFYIIGAIMLIPIISYYLGIKYIFFKQAFIQVYLCGPVLVFLGLLLFFFIKKRLIGVFFLITGLWWLINVIYELLRYQTS
jgi:hypothetical protein